ncbi:hypothetical protein EE612_025765 [Oryza sativa]|nr:hypothetical protein EE612_025765 [Oryza sativa]
MSSMFLIILSCMLLLSNSGRTTTGAELGDTLGKGRNITDGERLVSAGGSFTLGFFSPASSSSSSTSRRYLGIWFSVSDDVVCWVANRDRPLTDTSGVLVITDAGSLLLLDGSGHVVWSSNTTTGGGASMAAQLLESGNLVVSDRGNGGAGAVVVWQSFDHPCDTLLPGMKIGKNLWTGAEWYLSSWRSSGDPSPGNYRYRTDTKGVPENVLWDGDGEVYRTGPWNGLWFSGIPEMGTYSDMFSYQLTVSPGEITFGYSANAGAPFSRLVVTGVGEVQRLVWEPSSRAWKNFFQGPRDLCDDYGKCGAFGLCDAGAASTSFCSCVEGFTPASPSPWKKMRDTSAGCRRDAALGCATDGFLAVRGVKLPDAHNATVDKRVTVEECRARCLANCSCVAYAPADIGGGGGGGARSGCIIWADDLVDLRYVDGGQDLYVRLAKSELGKDGIRQRRPPAAVVIGASIASVVGVLLIILLVLLYVIRRRQRPRVSDDDAGVPAATAAVHARPNPALAAPSINLSSVKEATGNFSESNIIGRGGFGIVYQGKLPSGRKVAVKRLTQSLVTDKRKEDFIREVEMMSNTRHAYLVELLCYCQEGGEMILVYEYMENMSLDLYIFGEDRRLRASLNWVQRLDIIRGIAIGVEYLHNVKVIHRDLKPSNILLDDNWRPKVADFGTAKLFINDQTDPTLVLSAGYIAPEYAAQGNLTLKCDVYSFGVVLLEIISGKRNRTLPTFLRDTWESWKQHEIEDILDLGLIKPEPDLLLGLDRCIQIGLLCVQQSPDDRPTMNQVVSMLTKYSSQIAMPKNPMINSRCEPSVSQVVSDTEPASHDRPGPSLN